MNEIIKKLTTQKKSNSKNYFNFTQEIPIKMNDTKKH